MKRLPTIHRVRMLILLLLLSILSGMLFGCNNGNPVPPSTTVTDTAEETETGSDYPSTADYGGRSFRIMHRTNYAYEFKADGYSGAKINDAVYARNQYIEERYNISITNLTYTETWQNREFSGVLTTQMNAGEDASDLIAGDQHYTVPTILNGWYLTWQEIPYLNLQASEWQNGITDVMTINGRTYAITGDIALTFWKFMSCMVFNKNLALSYGDENLYQVVTSERWTLEYMLSLCKEVGGEYGGIPVYGYASDWDVSVDAFKDGFDAPSLIIEEDGNMRFDVVNEKSQAVAESLIDLYQAEYSYVKPGEDPSKTLFSSGNVLFNPMRFEMIERLRKLEFDYGVLPYPKWNEAQTGYCTGIADGVSMFLVSKYVPDTEFVGIITRALAEESRKDVVPEYINIVLKGNSVRDQQSTMMVDLIRNSVYVDPGYVLVSGGGLALRNVVDSVLRGTDPTTLTEYWKKKEGDALKKLENIKNFYAK